MNKSIDDLRQMLLTLMSQWGLDCFYLDENHSCEFSDEVCDFFISFTDDREEIAIGATVAESIDFTENRELLIRLLAMNTEESSLMGSFLSLDRGLNKIVLNYHAPVKALSTQDIGNMICNFSESANTVVDLLRELISDTHRSRKESQPSSDRALASFYKV